MSEKTVRIAGFPVSITDTEIYLVAWHPETGLITTATDETEVIRKMGLCLTRHFEFGAKHGINPYVDEAYLTQ
jgi:hypothetical protein